MSYIIPPNREWTPAIAAHNEPPVLDLESDWEERLAFPADKHRMVLGLGGIPVEVRTDSDGVAEYFSDAFGAFFETSEPRVRVAIGDIPQDEFPLQTLIGTMFTYARGDRIVGKFREMAGYIDTAQSVGRGLVERGNYRQNLVNYLRLVIDAMTPRLQAVLFHTAAIARDGYAYLFYGAATAGKSTITHLAARKHEVMTDDMLVLRMEDGQLRAATCGFWGGETKQYPTKRLDLPVKAFYRLKKSKTNRVRPADRTRAALDVVCGIPSMTRPPADHRFILDLASEAAARVPFYELRFQKEDDSFWSVIDEQDR